MLSVCRRPHFHACLLLAGLGVCLAAHGAEPSPGTYRQIVLADQPLAYWTFEGEGDARLQVHPESSAAKQLVGCRAVGQVKLGAKGPPPEIFPLFAKDNTAAEFAGDGGRMVLADPGEKSPLDFDTGDTITLEAWVNCTKLGNDQQIYIVGKGRTNNAGVARENQNYALRLRGDKSTATVSFLFRSADNRAGERDDFHRWNSKTGFPVKSGWHHVAVSYTFGEPESIRGYIDGEAVKGTWDYGGATKEAPVVDNDELWIGSSLGGNPSSSFSGQLDEVALYRTALSAERIAARYSAIKPQSYVTDEKLLPKDAFLVEVLEGVPDQTNWNFPLPVPTERYTEPALALTQVLRKYTSHGVRGERSNPFVLRVSGKLALPSGEWQLLLRSRNAMRCYIDDKLVAENKFAPLKGDGHNEVHPINVEIVPGVRYLPTGDQETLISVTTTGQPQKIALEIYCGGRGHRPELGETLAAMVQGSEPPRIISFGEKVELTDAPFLAYVAVHEADHARRNRERRAEASREYTAYWQRRHLQARERLANASPLALPDEKFPQAIHNNIDRYINAGLAAAKVEPLPLSSDEAFLRRAALDIHGVIPSPEMFAAYYADPTETRRAQFIDRLLADDRRWADHWTSYWQDVLAENPNIINPTLNNTGPFRYWIHESFEDNKPFDRFATELILMEGSHYEGGPAGFAMASQNDSPMAAKAHVIAQAFLGMEMKCARCHDAPYHDFTQKQLFSLAAMLKRGEEQVPKSSTIPGDPDALKSLLVKVTLKPGEKIPPEWPFAKIIDGDDAVDLLTNKTDQRERLAALVTAPENHRFSQVLVNRLWQRYLGRGIVEPVDDWEQPQPTHPELLEYLERKFVASGYDLKHVARLILNSHTYQRAIDAAAETDRERAKLFAGAQRRRLTAEQVVDSLFAAADKPLHVEPLNIDVDSGRDMKNSINLGLPTRAWQFTSLSNERDRPSLSLPAAQNVIDVLEAFGWRSSRPDPLTKRPEEVTVLQPAILANGVIGKRITQLSDDSAFTALALEEAPVETFIEQVYQRILTRQPTAEETEAFAELLAPGYAERVVSDAPLRMPGPPPQTGVSWSNHLKPLANERKTALKQQLEAGDPVTLRLAPEWRERAEDLVWTLINSPEFIVTP